MDHILPPSIAKLDRPLPDTPKMDRSMTESFMLEHSHHQNMDRSISDLESSTASLLPYRDDMIVPLSNQAHLALVTNQRNTLRSELRSQRAANSEVHASVSSLRRLALRLAVNISVKEKRIANSTRNLALSRNNEYLAGRSAEKRIEILTKCWKEEERRSREILDSLEQMNMLTLQCMVFAIYRPRLSNICLQLQTRIAINLLLGTNHG